MANIVSQLIYFFFKFFIVSHTIALPHFKFIEFMFGIVLKKNFDLGSRFASPCQYGVGFYKQVSTDPM